MSDCGVKYTNDDDACSEKSEDSGLGKELTIVQKQEEPPEFPAFPEFPEFPEPPENELPQEEYCDMGCKGGYYRIKIGDIIQGGRCVRYRVVAYKGCGYFSTAWIVENIYTDNRFILKIVKSRQNYTQFAEEEVDILKSVKGLSNMLQIVGYFSIPDTFSKGLGLYHKCIVMKDHGENLLKLQYHFKNGKVPFRMIKEIGHQLLKGVAALHAKNLIHSDLKPENIVFKLDEKGDIFVTIIDLGNAQRPDSQYFKVSTQEYRSFENLIGLPVDYKTDIWSIACILFELATNEYLFKPQSTPTYSENEDHIALIFESLLTEREMPEIPFVHRGLNFEEYFEINQESAMIELKNIKDLTYWSLKDVLIQKYAWDDILATEFSALLLPMLELNPEERISASNALKQWSS